MPKKRLIGKPKNADISFIDRKFEVLLTAARLFNKQGYHKTTMDDIAAALGVTKPALYYYAKSKDEVLYEVISHALSDTSGPQLPSDDDPRPAAEQLREYFRAWAVMICGDFGRCLITTQSSSLETPTRKKSTNARRKIHKRIEEILEKGMVDGSIRQVDAKLAALGLFDLYNGIAHWHDAGGRRSPEEIADSHWDVFVSGMLS